VFARGFAYEARVGVWLPGTHGRKALHTDTLSGSPFSRLLDSGEWQAIDTLQDAHIFRSSGFDLIEHLHFDGVEPPTPEEALERDLAACDPALSGTLAPHNIQQSKERRSLSARNKDGFAAVSRHVPQYA